MFDWNVSGFNVGSIIFNTIIALVITLVIGKLHEVIHMVTAQRLGYKVTGFKLWKNEVDVDIKPDDPNFRKIANAPYYIMIPVGIALTIVGLFLYPGEFFLGIFIAGVATLFLHGLSFLVEGKDVKREVFLMQEKTSDTVVSEKQP